MSKRVNELYSDIIIKQDVYELRKPITLNQ